jgi:hypothetical protein
MKPLSKETKKNAFQLDAQENSGNFSRSFFTHESPKVVEILD